MTIQNFKYLIDSSDMNGAIDIDDIVAINFIDSLSESEVKGVKIPNEFKRSFILPYLKNTFIVYMDKYGNGYSRMIY